MSGYQGKYPRRKFRKVPTTGASRSNFIFLKNYFFFDVIWLSRLDRAKAENSSCVERLVNLYFVVFLKQHYYSVFFLSFLSFFAGRKKPLSVKPMFCLLSLCFRRIFSYALWSYREHSSVWSHFLLRIFYLMSTMFETINHRQTKTPSVFARENLAIFVCCWQPVFCGTWNKSKKTRVGFFISVASLLLKKRTLAEKGLWW